MKFLEESLIALDVEANSPEEAIISTGTLLKNNKLVEETYVNAMVHSFKTNGPYFVLAPNIALPHARPEDGVNEACVSFVRLKTPVKFGHSYNDPVRLVFGLGASSSIEHVTVLQKLMALLSDQENVEKLLTAQSYEEIKPLLGGQE
ncbi:PTS sugar transporter subunit IIA [Robertmurraya sp. DFI.2.37]|uniref:PTS sugar transporter subunit IIA n=1 Tax=Robertmurraya TaxID=2837507 RepID=UPI000BA5B2AD|nr:MULTISPECIES: PTS sugar transporter subunit IIA [Robertmurraya]MDF1508127.1 PTS sugar transporter subunit IIA [Robertmurraya sp. DFI.2.37]PAE18761.1 PTS sugar transporter subunit IIA [Bacillus sp. 7504-2]